LVSDRCLDPELAALDDPVTVVVDVSDDHRDRDLAGLGYLILRSSSAAAKTLQTRRISFARRSSRTSRSSSLIRDVSSEVVPGRRPPSISAWRTQVRSASG